MIVMKNINKIWIIVIIISSVVLSFCMIAKPVDHPVAPLVEALVTEVEALIHLTLTEGMVS